MPRWNHSPLKKQIGLLELEVYNKIQSRRFEDEKALDDLFNELIELRQKIAHD